MQITTTILLFFTKTVNNMHLIIIEQVSYVGCQKVLSFELLVKISSHISSVLFAVLGVVVKGERADDLTSKRLCCF